MQKRKKNESPSILSVLDGLSIEKISSAEFETIYSFADSRLEFQPEMINGIKLRSFAMPLHHVEFYLVVGSFAYGFKRIWDLECGCEAVRNEGAPESNQKANPK